MTPILGGPRLPPEDGRPARQLVVLLHGYGADGNDLIDLGRAWRPILPGALFVSPHAPEPFENAPYGRQWFSLSDDMPGQYFRGAASAAPALNRFLDAELAALGLDDSRLVLVGFSQGAMTALYAGPRREKAIAGILSYSGLLVGPERLAAEARHRPPVMLVHGSVDQVIPAAALPAAKVTLEAAGFPTESHVRPGLGHGIDQTGLVLGAGFLKRTLGLEASS